VQLVLYLGVPPSRRERVGARTGRALLFGRCSRVCREKHVEPLIYLCQAEDLIVHFASDIENEVEVIPICSRWLLLAVAGRVILAGVLVLLLWLMSLALLPCILRRLGGLGGDLLNHVAGGIRPLIDDCGGVGPLTYRLKEATGARACAWVPILRNYEKSGPGRAWRAACWYNFFYDHPWRRSQFELSSSGGNCHGSFKFFLLLAPGLCSIPGRPASRSPSDSRHDWYPAKNLDAICICQVAAKGRRSC
jgi:hypothetical protein